MKVTFAADVYSLGRLILCGHNVNHYDATDDAIRIGGQLACPCVPAAWFNLAMRCMETNPGNRPTASGVLAAIEDIIAEQQQPSLVPVVVADPVPEPVPEPAVSGSCEMTHGGDSAEVAEVEESFAVRHRPLQEMREGSTEVAEEGCSVGHFER